MQLTAITTTNQQNIKLNKKAEAQITEKKETKKQIITPKKAIIAGAVSLPIIFLAIAIGRNPIQAAKHLKGNINNYANSAYKNAETKLNELLKNKSISEFFDIDLSKIVEDCPKDLLPKNGIFYHGTKHSSKIYKNGFTPYASNQLHSFAREFGAGVYLTPSEKVAQNFKYFAGKIIPVKVSDAKIAQVNLENYNEAIRKITSHFTIEQFEDCKGFFSVIKKMFLNRKNNNALIETAVRKMFIQSGYDGIYISKGVASGSSAFTEFFPDVNKIIGMDQSQLVLFSPEKLEILPRGFKQRLSDIPKGIKATLNQIINGTKEQYRISFKLYKDMFPKD